VEKVRILATADVHTPRFLNEFKGNLSAHEPPDMFLFAGDMINRGSAEEYRTVLDVIEETLGDSFPIIGCFGNEEYSEVRNDILSIVGERMLFLDETSTITELNGVKIGIVGTQGSLDRATSWQRRNIPGMKSVFERRAKRAESLLKKIDKNVDRRILLMHYSPCLETCEGEEDRAFSWLGSRKFYKIVDKQQPDLVVHGHVHNSVRHEAMIGRTLVRNVSFPAVGSIATMDLWN
jgi:Icc-related predicted phosphoesterase